MGSIPLAAPSQLGWGYQTTWGSFAQFCKVQAQQLLPKPPGALLGRLVGLRSDLLHGLPDADRPVRPAGRAERPDLGRRGRARGVRAHSSARAPGRMRWRSSHPPRRASWRRSSEPIDYIDRTEFAGNDAAGAGRRPRRRGTGSPSHAASRSGCKEILGDAPDIVFEHVGKETFPTSVLVAKPFGTGRHLRRDHAATCSTSTSATCGCGRSGSSARTPSTPTSAWRANQLIAEGKIRPVLWRADGASESSPRRIGSFTGNRHLGKISILVGATGDQDGKHEEGPGAIRVGLG